MDRKDYRNIFILFLLYFFLNFLVFIREGDFLYPMLSWNVFLSILPLVFMDRLDMEDFKFRDLVLLLAWVFFFPNAVYMVTDLIHLAGLDYVRLVGDSIYTRTLVYRREMGPWIRLFLLAMGFLFSTGLGLESLYIFYRKLETRVSKYIARGMLVLMAILAGMGVYIGRFLRFNSWDLLIRPLSILKEGLGSLDIFAVSYIGTFSLYSLFIFALYGAIKRRC